MLESVKKIRSYGDLKEKARKIADCCGFEHFGNIKDSVNKQKNNGVVVLDILMQKCYI